MEKQKNAEVHFYMIKKSQYIVYKVLNPLKLSMGPSQGQRVAAVMELCYERNYY